MEEVPQTYGEITAWSSRSPKARCLMYRLLFKDRTGRAYIVAVSNHRGEIQYHEALCTLVTGLQPNQESLRLWAKRLPL